MELETLPLYTRNNSNLLKNNFNKDTCSVEVRYLIYDRKRKCIIKTGESRPLSIKNKKISIHAEERALKDCLQLNSQNKCEIYIWKYSKKGEVKKKNVCLNCYNLLCKYNYENRIYTFDNGEIVSAIDNPEISLGNMIKNKYIQKIPYKNV